MPLLVVLVTAVLKWEANRIQYRTEPLPALMLHHCCTENKQKTGWDMSIYSCYTCRVSAHTALKLEYIPYLFNDSFLSSFALEREIVATEEQREKGSLRKQPSSASWHKEHNTAGNLFGHTDQSHCNAF